MISGVFAEASLSETPTPIVFLALAGTLGLFADVFSTGKCTSKQIRVFHGSMFFGSGTCILGSLIAHEMLPSSRPLSISAFSAIGLLILMSVLHFQSASSQFIKKTDAANREHQN